MTTLETTGELNKLIGVVAKATEDFISKTGNRPTHVVLNRGDFNLKGEVEVCGYKVLTSPLIPSGEAVVIDKNQIGY